MKTDLHKLTEAYDSVKQAHHATDELHNYMLFRNLETIKQAIDKILSMDAKHVDHIVSQGHDWANDHVAEAKNNIEQVADFLSTSK